MSNEFPNLFSPMALGPMTIPNRICFSAHTSHLVEDGLPTEKQAQYYAERAKGGVGWIVIGGSVAHESSWSHPQLNLIRDEAIPGYRRIIEVVHEHGTMISTQMDVYGAAVGYPRAGRSALLSPSGIADVGGLEVPKIMQEEDMVDVIESSANAARIAREAGFDGVELLASMGFSLIQSFLSPRTNRRTDEYGGSLENRMRFPLRLISRVRQVLGPEICFGIKLTGDELVEGGLDQEELQEIAVRFADSSLIDYLHVCIGTMTDSSTIVPEMSFAPGFASYLAAGIRERVDIPVVAVKRINDPIQAEKLIADGEADVVAMVRALLADPELPNKAREGRLRQIRQCTASNQECAGRSWKWFPMSCIHNPSVGREAELGIGTLRPAESPLDVVVIGGGPGGMKTAEIAAERGHRVRLFEADDQLGGQVKWMTAVNSRKDYESITRYLVNRIEDLGVDVQLGSRMDAAAVRGLGADVVVVATGALGLKSGYNAYEPTRLTMPGADQDNVLTVFDVFGDISRVGERVLLIDEFSDYEGGMIAEYLADNGRSVEIVGRMPYYPMNINGEDIGVAMGRLLERGIASTPFTAVTAIDGTTVSGRHELTGAEWGGEFDTVVLHMGKRPNESLYLELYDLSSVHRVGDCVAPRRVTDAIFEGNALARSL